MAEHDSEREDREERERPEGHEPEEQRVPFDEDAAWAAIVAGYGEEPPDPPGAKPFKSVEDLALLEPETNGEQTVDGEAPAAEKAGSEPAKPLGSSVAFAPGIGPRDYSAPEPSDDDLDESDEGHFVPPEPPPLPEADVTSKFAWLGVLGGPVLPGVAAPVAVALASGFLMAVGLRAPRPRPRACGGACPTGR
ncbi:hypothetical protein N4P33_19985, partial [Streptomyces sp. 15-116A]|uniref:hypothetical protein n=1 Tax=Streptomyces sp. 15-116A TaxID=2259035 RepID=UPI0021B18A35